MCKLEVTYVDRETNALAGSMIFQGSDLAEAQRLATAWRAAHPSLQDASCTVLNPDENNVNTKGKVLR